MSKFLTIKEVADICGVSRDTIRNLYKSNQFPKPVRIGSSLRWDSARIDKFMADKQAEAA